MRELGPSLYIYIYIPLEGYGVPHSRIPYQDPARKHAEVGLLKLVSYMVDEM